jgi:cyanophycin synthetase
LPRNCWRGPRLQGDGIRSVHALIQAENARRGAGGHGELDTDRDCLFTLECQGLALDSVPRADRVFLVKSVNDAARKYQEVRTVYNEAVTDSICESIRLDSERTARLVGSDFLGVDVITTDPTQPLHQSGGVINEVNTTPALHHHYEKDGARYPDAALLAVRALLGRAGAGN